MSRSTISTFQLFALFPDEETARRGQPFVTEGDAL